MIAPAAAAVGVEPPRAGARMTRRRTRSGRALRATGWTLIILGLYVLEFAAYSVFGTSLVTKGHQDRLRNEFAAIADDPTVTPTPSASPGAQPPARSVPSRAIALLKIPVIGVDVVVVEGVSLKALARGPGRYPQTARVGQRGSLAIAGHRTGWGSPFLNMDRVRPGHTLTVEAPDGTIYTYRVTRTTVVGPDDAWVLKGNPDSKATHQLTLTTCTPKFTSRNRLIVWSDLVSTRKT